MREIHRNIYLANHIYIDCNGWMFAHCSILEERYHIELPLKEFTLGIFTDVLHMTHISTNIYTESFVLEYSGIKNQGTGVCRVPG